LWLDRFNGDRGVLGRSVRLDGRAFEIVGVMAPSFDFPKAPSGRPVDFWSPIAEPIGNYYGRHYLKVVARMKEGVTLGQARADMARVAREVSDELPDLNRGHDAR